MLKCEFLKKPKIHHVFWLLLKENLSPRTLKKSPNLVTLLGAIVEKLK